jgi:hypothetical protein
LAYRVLDCIQLTTLERNGELSNSKLRSFLIYIFNKRVRVHYGMRRAARRISRGDTDKAISTLERLVEKYQKFDHPRELLSQRMEQLSK